MGKDWKEIAAAKNQRINDSIPKEWRIDTSSLPDNVMDIPATSGILSRTELDITNSSATDLVAKLAAGKLKAVDVTTAFCKRAAISHQVTNCALEFFPEMALKQAKELDDFYEKNGRTVGPLHGLPISLKDQLRIKGLETTMGYVAWIDKYDTEDSVLTAMLRKAGAVFYVKTSVPQSLMVCETVNNITGRSVNPRNKHLSPGGSSGGEGANVGIRGGIIGVGTDIGGSIRVPSAFNFLYGLRPSHGRLPYGKMANSMEGQETVHSVVGPITHSVPDMRLFVQSVLEQEPWKHDSKVIPMPWRQSEHDAAVKKITSDKLTLGFFNNDGVVMPHPPILRGVDKVVSILRENGHEVIDWKPYRHDYAVDLIQGIYASDAGKDIHTVLSASGEPAIPNINDLVDPSISGADITKLWDVQLQKWTFQMEYIEEWNKLEEKLGKEMDAFIMPITPTAAIRHNQFKYYGYASAINLLDFTSVVVPVTFADKNLDKKNERFKPMNDMDKQVQEEYDAEAYHGAPVAVQIVGRRLTEEKTMAIAEEIGKLLGNAITP
ncbi:glutamyl-tRNA amidotransferas-like protein subunit A [Aureobasidium pullulans]|uniref:amidase n=1 Tax=Aureobasidium pullulans TaxID=5580 RepID=A0A4S9PSG5_AURPU|nr:glutamyl-tRNA amidotransferas-like protein subunit A [Aureobasidium pullulans]THZ41528.1 glutamyl-tRNA amidotransferas-like protein subunit A [Aureobasidium pullulans]THZ60343.1 glutamyl-tRNA amidotransferas-like protein subunit A [Aureobasidium pullulans]